MILGVICPSPGERFQCVACLTRGGGHAVDTCSLGEIADHPQRKPHAFDRIRHQVLRRELQKLRIRWNGLALPFDCFGYRGIRVRIGEHAQQEYARRSVDCRVVRFGEHRPAPIGKALDHVDLPQRVRSIHGTPDDARDLLGELVGSPWRGKPDVANVVIEIEVRIVQPIRMVELEWNFDETTAHRFESTDHRPEAIVCRLERVEIGRGSFVDREPVHMTERGRRLHVQKARIEP